MKKMMVVLVALVVTLGFTVSAFAQEERLEKEVWQKQMNEQASLRNDAKARLEKLSADIAALKQQSAQKDIDLKKCEGELLALVGATQADVDAYEAKVAALEGKVNDLSRVSNEDLLSRKAELDNAQKALDELKASKLSLLPAFYDRLAALQQKVDGLKGTLSSMEKFYTVGTWAKDRDCLWNISKKKDIYANPFMWPKIWQGNRDKIKDPDVIHKGQKLKIPNAAPMSADEKKAANKYYRSKAAAAAPAPAKKEGK
ncbi:MAG: hypothetical protein ABSB78_04785 [Bacteroidota bacterium]